MFSHLFDRILGDWETDQFKLELKNKDLIPVSFDMVGISAISMKYFLIPKSFAWFAST
jgi:hypothetical protein